MKLIPKTAGCQKGTAGCQNGRNMGLSPGVAEEGHKRLRHRPKCQRKSRLLHFNEFYP